MVACKSSVHPVLSEERKLPKPSLAVHAYNICDISSKLDNFTKTTPCTKKFSNFKKKKHLSRKIGRIVKKRKFKSATHEPIMFKIKTFLIT